MSGVIIQASFLVHWINIFLSSFNGIADNFSSSNSRPPLLFRHNCEVQLFEMEDERILLESWNLRGTVKKRALVFGFAMTDMVVKAKSIYSDNVLIGSLVICALKIKSSILRAFLLFSVWWTHLFARMGKMRFGGT